MKKIRLIIILLLFVFFTNTLSYIKNDKTSTNDKITFKVEDTITQKKSNIYIGMDKQDLISSLGQPDRIDISEYGFEWYIYNKDYQNFMMVGIEDKKVVAFYSNSIKIKELGNIAIGDRKDKVRTEYTPLEYKQKNNIKFMINSQDQYDIIKKEDVYITLFYDIHDDNKICSYQIIEKNTEEKTEDIYGEYSLDLIESFENQTIDLINSDRQKEGLNTLEYSSKARNSAMKHSKDMSESEYFDHTNLKGEDPFDRMNKEDIIYIKAGENIAAGQTSAIYAHEALMNSMGHRKNILGEYKYVGVGVEFGGSYKTYYTQNFYK